MRAAWEALLWIVFVGATGFFFGIAQQWGKLVALEWWPRLVVWVQGG